MKKSFFLFVCVFVCLSWAGSALAVTTTIDYAFTSDNYVSSFKLLDSNGLVENFGSKTTEWTTAAAGQYKGALTAGAYYTLQWDVFNKDNKIPSEPGDPMAFVGQFSVNGVDYFSSSATGIWKITGTDPQYEIESYGAFNDPTKIWYYTNNGYNLLKSYIGDAAYWIGLGAYPGQDYKMTVSATFMAPVPIPGAALLLGSAMLGLVGLRRTRMV